MVDILFIIKIIKAMKNPREGISMYATPCYMVYIAITIGSKVNKLDSIYTSLCHTHQSQLHAPQHDAKDMYLDYSYFLSE